MRSWIAIVLVLLAFPLATAGTGPAEIHAGDGAFSPNAVRVGPHEPVLFVNDDDRPHTVTSVWDEGHSVNVVLKPGQRLRITFEQPGSYEFRCTPHSTTTNGHAEGMVATVEVAGAAATAPTRSPELVAGIAFVSVLFLLVSGGAFGWTRLRARR